MAAAQLMVTIAHTDGTVRPVQGYADDTNTDPVRFDDTKTPVAGSSDSFTMIKPGYLIDIVTITDLATPKGFQVLVNDNPYPGAGIIHRTICLISQPTRPKLAIWLRAGDKVKLVQVA